MQVFNENKDELCQNIKLMESDIKKLKDRLCLVNFINELELKKEDFENIIDFKVTNDFNASYPAEYHCNQDGTLIIEYAYNVNPNEDTNINIRFKVEYSFVQTYENRYEPDEYLSHNLKITGDVGNYSFKETNRTVNCSKNKKSITLLKKILSKSYDIEEEDVKEEREFWAKLMQL